MEKYEILFFFFSQNIKYLTLENDLEVRLAGLTGGDGEVGEEVKEFHVLDEAD